MERYAPSTLETSVLEDNTEMSLKEIMSKDLNWTQVVRDAPNSMSCKRGNQHQG
jgi:hypothetical protein